MNHFSTHSVRPSLLKPDITRKLQTNIFYAHRYENSQKKKIATQIQQHTKRIIHSDQVGSSPRIIFPVGSPLYLLFLFWDFISFYFFSHTFIVAPQSVLLMAALESVPDNPDLCHLGVVMYFYLVWDLLDSLWGDFLKTEIRTFWLLTKFCSILTE